MRERMHKNAVPYKRSKNEIPRVKKANRRLFKMRGCLKL